MDYDTLVQRFVDELTRRGKARLTVKTYRSDLLVFRTWCVRNAPDVVGEVGNLRYDHILAFLRHDRVHEPLPVQPSRFNPHPTAGLPARGAHYAARTYQRKTVVLRVFCAWAESEHYLGRSPFPTNMGMKARADMGALRAAPIYLSEADMARLWAAVMAGLPGNKSWQQWRDRALFGLMDLCQVHGHLKFAAMSNKWNRFHPLGGADYRCPRAAPSRLPQGRLTPALTEPTPDIRAFG